MATALVQQAQTNPPTPSSAPHLSERLNMLLTGSESSTDHVIGPNTAQQLRQFIVDLEAWEQTLEPTTPAELNKLVSGLSLATKERPCSPQEARVRLDLFWIVLKDVPLRDLKHGWKQLLSTKTFMPVPAEFLKAAQASVNRRNFLKFRAKMFIRTHERLYRPPIDEGDRPSKDEVMALLSRVAGIHTTNRESCPGVALGEEGGSNA